MCAYRTDEGESSGASGGAACAGPDVGARRDGRSREHRPLKRFGVSGGQRSIPDAL